MGVYCFKCREVFSSQSNLNRHLRRVHNQTNQVVSYAKECTLFQCEACKISFKKNAELRNHLEIKHHIKFEEELLSFESYEGKLLEGLSYFEF